MELWEASVEADSVLAVQAKAVNRASPLDMYWAVVSGKKAFRGIFLSYHFPVVQAESSPAVVADLVLPDY